MPTAIATMEQRNDLDPRRTRHRRQGAHALKARALHVRARGRRLRLLAHADAGSAGAADHRRGPRRDQGRHGLDPHGIPARGCRVFAGRRQPRRPLRPPTGLLSWRSRYSRWRPSWRPQPRPRRASLCACPPGHRHGHIPPCARARAQSTDGVRLSAAAFGWIPGMIGLGAGLALVMGGVVVDALSWRWIFVLGAGLIVASGAMVVAWVPRGNGACTLAQRTGPGSRCSQVASWAFSSRSRRAAAGVGPRR